MEARPLRALTQVSFCLSAYFETLPANVRKYGYRD
jgi:hypothetical protein